MTSRFVEFFSRPWGAMLAFAVGIIGTGYGVVSYYESHAARQLICQIDPATTQIVRAGQASSLTVSYNGQPIINDITAARVVLWNAGKLPIKKENVLKPVVLETANKVPILEATVRTVSRDVAGVSIDTSEISKGRLKVGWEILEQNDGLGLQFIYAGSLATKVSVEGVIEGQSDVLTGAIASSYSPLRYWSIIACYTFLLICGLGMARFDKQDAEKDINHFGRIVRLIPYAFILGSLIAILVIFFQMQRQLSAPPTKLLSESLGPPSIP